MKAVLRCENYVQVDALVVVDFTMLYVVTCRLLLSSRVLTVINNGKGQNLIATLVQSMPPVDCGPVFNAVLRGVTFHDDHLVKAKTRQYLDVYAIELETISEPS